ncbi:hypothetical protein HOLleu_44851 [Holothuria leucospilota]|uniref:Uncharacterized protein n=1 Tax=Holothuria leucospilota TaxID=206669 RepID=A0A9Q1BA80_HOLLE|nr:hypothetical protein HOLleu_44851 [Holothuria leucospilota]
MIAMKSDCSSVIMKAITEIILHLKELHAKFSKLCHSGLTELGKACSLCTSYKDTPHIFMKLPKNFTLQTNQLMETSYSLTFSIGMAL